MALPKDDEMLRAVAREIVSAIKPVLSDIWRSPPETTPQFHSGGAIMRDGTAIGRIANIKVTLDGSECVLPAEFTADIQRRIGEKAAERAASSISGTITCAFTTAEVEAPGPLIVDNIWSMMRSLRPPPPPLPTLLVSWHVQDREHVLMFDPNQAAATSADWERAISAAPPEFDGWCHPWMLVRLAQKARELGWRPVRRWKRKGYALYGWCRRDGSVTL